MNERKDTAIEAFKRLRAAIEKAGPHDTALEDDKTELEKARSERYFGDGSRV